MCFCFLIHKQGEFILLSIIGISVQFFLESFGAVPQSNAG